MSYCNLSFHDTRTVKIERHKLTSSNRLIEQIRIVLTDDKDQTFELSSISDKVGIEIEMPATTAATCVLAMKRKFAVNGLKDELFGGESEGLSNEEIADALVRYLESYGAKFQADDAV